MLSAKLSGLHELVDLSRFASRLYGPRTAVVDEGKGKKYSYTELEERAARVAGFLEEHGVGPGDRVAYLLYNGVECIDLFYASGKLGSILVPINWRLTPIEVRHILEDIRPKVLVYDVALRRLVEEALRNTDLAHFRIVARGEPREEEYGYEEMLASKALRVARSVDLEETRMILYTGGTTGFPKGAMISARQVLFNVFSEILTWRLHEGHKAPILLPLFHTGGWNLLTLPLLARGGTVHLVPKFDPEWFIEHVETVKGPHLVFGVPTIYYLISRSPGFKDARFAEVEWMLSGAAPIHRNIMEKYWEKGIKMGQGYGLTEGGPNNLTMPIHEMSLEEIKEKWSSVGKPFAFSHVLIVGSDGSPQGPGRYGEIVVCGPLVFSGYWGRPEETQETLREGCVYTGDIGFYDEDGYFYIINRKKDIIKSGGEQVYPREIEDIVREHPLVEDAAVIGVPDEKWGEVPKLIVKLKEGAALSKEDLLGFLEGRIARYKMPKYVAIVDEIPRSVAGKVLKRILRERHGEPRDELQS